MKKNIHGAYITASLQQVLEEVFTKDVMRPGSFQAKAAAEGKSSVKATTYTGTHHTNNVLHRTQLVLVRETHRQTHVSKLTEAG